MNDSKESSVLDLITYRGMVYPWHCDHIGHMNVMRADARRQVRRGNLALVYCDGNYAILSSRQRARHGGGRTTHCVQARVARGRYDHHSVGHFRNEGKGDSILSRDAERRNRRDRGDHGADRHSHRSTHPQGVSFSRGRVGARAKNDRRLRSWDLKERGLGAGRHDCRAIPSARSAFQPSTGEGIRYDKEIIV